MATEPMNEEPAIEDEALKPVTTLALPATARCAILFREMCELARRTQSATNGKS